MQSSRLGRVLRRRALPTAILLPLLAGGCASLGIGEPGTGLAGRPSDTLLRLARTTGEAGDPRASAGFYQAAHEAAPTAVEPLVGLGDSLRAQALYREAADAYGRAAALDPANKAALRGLGLSLVAVDQAQAALGHLDTLLAIDPADLKAWNARGVALDLLGRHDEAQAAYRSGLAVEPGDAALRNNLGLSLAISGRYDTAIAVLEGLTRQSGATPRNRQNLALAYGLSGDRDRAAEVAKRDLKPEAVQGNLAIYDTLREQRPEPRAEAAQAVLQPEPRETPGERSPAPRPEVAAKSEIEPRPMPGKPRVYEALREQPSVAGPTLAVAAQDVAVGPAEPRKGGWRLVLP